MKHIGIVDVTTVGACLCANEIVARAMAQNKEGSHPEFSLHSLPFNLYKDAVLAKDIQQLAELVLTSINKLKASGAEFVIIPSNTPHYAIDRILSVSPLPVLSILDLVVEQCANAGYEKVATLGTAFTMESGLYDQHLRAKGIEPVLAGETLRKDIDSFIMEEIIPSKVSQASLAHIIQGIQEIDCDAVILGCTELPEVLNTENMGLPGIDSTRLLAHKALAYALVD